MSGDTTLEGIAAELYTAPLGEFVAARNARAKETSDAELAASIRALRKPSVAAWVVNVFARERASQLGEALHLAEELREAQADLDARALAQLGRDRRALTRRLASAAAELAKARGETVTASTLEAVTQTIAAAFFDQTAAAAVASGRLVRELEPAGTFSDIADTLVAGGAPDAAPAPAQPADEVAARRRRREAERALRDAEAAHDRATRDVTSAERSATESRTRIRELETRAAELEAELAGVRRDTERARADAEQADNRRTDATKTLGETEKAVQKAQQALDALPSRR
ncbi:hypothetical protein [Microbacterium sp. 3J1]|uniref:hypothetical protein n=1 Tax=Microbacterium sp. 3J1 TaxID=861269 RepID=UPI000AEAB83A|nr:hypothetical protein [Microbacterium sp. 3J1]